MIGCSARLLIDNNSQRLLDELLRVTNQAALATYQRMQRGQIEESQVAAYRSAMSFGLTANQADSVVSLVYQWRATDSGQRAHRMASLEARQDKQQKELSTLQRREAACATALEKSEKGWRAYGLKVKPNKVGSSKKAAAPKALVPPWKKVEVPASKKWAKAANGPTRKAKILHPREARANLEHAQKIVGMKRHGLRRTNEKLAILADPAYRSHRVMGGHKLLAQRHRIGQADCPWATQESWEMEWERKRYGSMTLVGRGADPGGNRGAVITWDRPDDPFCATGTIRVRRTNGHVDADRAQIAQKDRVPVDSVPVTEAMKYVVLAVVFPKNQVGLLKQAMAAGQPVTITIARKPVPKERKRLQRLNARYANHSQHPNAQKNRARKGRMQNDPTQKDCTRNWENEPRQESTQQAGGQAETFVPAPTAQTIARVSQPQEQGYYLTASFDTPKPLTTTTRQRGAIGVDLNGWGLSFAAVTFDGNMQFLRPEMLADPATRPHVLSVLKTLNIPVPVGWENGEFESSGRGAAQEKNKKVRGPALKGDLPIALDGKSSAQIRAAAQTYINALVELAKLLSCAISLEDLDFSSKKTYMRDTGPGYNRMLARLPTSKLEDMTRSRCLKVGVALHKVNPAWTSVAGFAKYGRILGLNPDQAGAFAIGRAAVLGTRSEWASKPVPTHSKSTGKKISPKFQRMLQERKNSMIIRFQETPRLARPVHTSQWTACATQGAQEFSSWAHVRNLLGPRAGWVPRSSEASGSKNLPAQRAPAPASSEGGGRPRRTGKTIPGMTNDSRVA